MIGKIDRLPLREVWKHEAKDFTTWLVENVDVLGEVLDLSLANVEREQNAGAFSVDLVAEDDQGHPVVIENQLEKSDHDHLGKLITYLTALDAKTAIWIVADPRPEHIAAVSWLNEIGTVSFYMLKAEAIRIGDSPPAPLLTLIVGPSEEAEGVGKTKKELKERHILRRKFWAQLLDFARTKTKIHANISPTIYNWLGAGTGKRGLLYAYSVAQHETWVYLYIDRGKDSEEENKAIFKKLEQSKETIEKAFGDPLEWFQAEGQRACRITKTVHGGYRDPEEKWPEVHVAMVDAMIRLDKALRPHIQKLEV